MCWFFIGGQPAQAKIYKWVDEHGKVHYTNDPTQIPQNEDAEVKTFREIAPPPPKEDQPSSEKETIPLVDEKGPIKPALPVPPKVTRNKEVKSPVEERESYQKLLEQARESRQKQLTKIRELQEMDEKPKNWTTNESLDEVIEGLKKSMKKTEKEIRKYENKVKSTSLTD
jgi:hypothetical protein